MVDTFREDALLSPEPNHYRFVHSSLEFEDLMLKGLITPSSTQLSYGVFRYVGYWSCVRMLSVFLIPKLTCLIVA